MGIGAGLAAGLWPLDAGAAGRISGKAQAQAAFEQAGGYTYAARIRQTLSGLGFSPRDFTRPIQGGPTQRGFDHYFGVDLPNLPPLPSFSINLMVPLPTLPAPPDLELPSLPELPDCPLD